MRELRFPKEVYPGAHVDAAMKVYARFGEFEREESETHWVVRITSGSRAKERRLAGELGNYALGLTIQGRDPLDGSPEDRATPGGAS
ncbi:MAG TPA: HxsD-like protein [Polyangiaceae bacterium LLY-WYZ-15_(1-7)]|nr:hypothetical protein [Sandaracinus sp.]HJK89487.1 HxsD-like protein [Polyangiaceae bacterium LLY-WYZ-15_(1-7)]HJL05793.1 HxsD-like protein [Polyangiaceae bacterium LLY-WYZ-15_(1-7)]HJL09903.1 HxsD-like protein [Polyangiaceae bacterium LLY-WYZ-15_(1-7)]HJL27298.1 HxsD-like protein [Polyangiaceae bacterium LLY-WYZ-15_(1-7)]